MKLIRETVLACVFGLSSSAISAALRATTNDAVLAVPSTVVQSAVNDGSFSCFVWIRPASEGTIFSIEDDDGVPLRLWRAPSGGLRCDVDVPARGLSTLLGGDAPSDEWTLAVIVADADAGEMRFSTRSLSGYVGDDALNMALPLSDSAGAVVLGDRATDQAASGDYGLVALRDHAVTQSDIDSVFATRQHLAPFTLDNTPAGTMTGPDGAIWMVNHAFSTRPANALPYPSLQAARAAMPGAAATETNVAVYQRVPPFPEQFGVVREIEQTSGMTYVSPFEDGELCREYPAPGSSSPVGRVVSSEAPRLHEIAQGQLTDVYRVVVSANSRGVQRNDGSGVRAANYADGFIHTFEPDVAGVLLRPAVTGRHPWPVLDTSVQVPRTSGKIENVAESDFARFFTGSNAGNGVAAGYGLLLEDLATYTIRSTSFGQIVPGAPLEIHAYLLRYPGSASVQLVRDQASSQGVAGVIAGQSTTVALDSTLDTHLFDPSGGDQYLPTGFLVLNSPVNVQVGDACAFDGGIAVVESVVPMPGAGDAVTIKLAFPLLHEPQAGQTLRFGPWSIERAGVSWPALEEGDPLEWRGVRLSAGGDGSCVVLFAFDAWRPDVSSGLIIGPAGWGGHGYAPQLDTAQPGATEAWMASTQADVWIQAFAQQDSGPEDFFRYADAIRTALPDAELLWAGESAHGSSTFASWHDAVTAGAAIEGVPAISLLDQERFGSVLDQFSAGLRSDENHYSAAGADLLAERWTIAMARASSPQPADFNSDGVVDGVDLATLLAAWGTCAQPCSLDLTGDGVVDAVDLAALLAEWG